MRVGYMVTYVVLALIGIADAAYLSAIHYYQTDPGCSLITGCDAVLSSEFAVILGVPLAYGGLFYYLLLLSGMLTYYQYELKKALQVTLVVNLMGFLFSLWLIYVQAFILVAFCQYCLFSALITTLALVTITIGFKRIQSDT
jgi:uncharacterized membrane protein